MWHGAFNPKAVDLARQKVSTVLFLCGVGGGGGRQASLATPLWWSEQCAEEELWDVRL